jgi:hypothetical protein
MSVGCAPELLCFASTKTPCFAEQRIFAVAALEISQIRGNHPRNKALSGGDSL